MKLVKVKPSEELTEDAVGLLAEEPDDMWSIYTLIAPGDVIKAETTRMQQLKGVAALPGGGKAPTQRLTCRLAIRVETSSWDNSVNEVRCKGKIVNESVYASIGQYHSLVLQLGKPVTVDKAEGWDSMSRKVVDEALREDKDGALAAVVMEDGLANVCLITSARTIVKRRLASESSTSKMRKYDEKKSAARKKAFYNKVLDALLLEIDFSNGPRPLLLASPGFVAADFRTFLANKAVEGVGKNKQLLEIAQNASVVPSATGHVHALNEILKTKGTANMVRDMRSVRETKDLETFDRMMREQDLRAWYGASDVGKLVEEGAVGGGGTLLVDNALFRHEDAAQRKKWVALVDKVAADGGNVRIISGEHGSGKRLAMLGGVAAIMTYPVYDLDEDEDEVTGGHVEIEVERPGEGCII